MANDSESRSPEFTPEAAHAQAESEAGAEDRGEDQKGEGVETGTSAPRTDIVYCVRCGAAMGRGDRFCHACGWDVRAEPPPPPPRRIEVNPSDRNRLAALLLCLLLGWLGAHRFYCGKVGTGLVWLFTLGFFGIGVIYDLVLIATGEFRDIDGRRLVRWE